MSDVFGLRIGGKTFTGWTRASVRRSLEAVAGKFELGAADRPGFPVEVGAEAVLTVDGEEVATGFVDRVSKTLARRELRVEGRDRTADLVDCSAIVPPYEFQDEGLSAIAAKLCDPFGIEVVLASDEGDRFPRFAVHPGEAAFEAIERGCRLRGLLATTDGLGRLVLQRPVGEEVGAVLVERLNVLDASIDLDGSQRFRDYLVLSHDGANGDPEALEAPDGRATDEGARAGRALVVLAEGAATAATCAKRATWEAAVRSARAARLSVSVAELRAGRDGPLWRPGLLALVSIPTLRTEGRMLVSEVEISQGKADGSGTRAELQLVRPDAYALEAAKPVTRDPEAEWDQDVAEEPDAGE